MSGSIRRTTELLTFVALWGACTLDETNTNMTVQEERAGAGGKIGLDLLVTDGSNATACDSSSLEVAVSASQSGPLGPFMPIDSSNVVVQCSSGAADVAVVIDNSGSEAGKLDELKAGASYLMDAVVNAGGRASLVRVSTNSSIRQTLTNDRAALAAATDDLFINNGWTSLWDGVRMGNQTLGGDVLVTSTAAGDARQFCVSSSKLAIVAFTDGYDNNSADEQAATYDLNKYPGDGVATTLGDLVKLRVDHVTTPIYTIGMGHEIDDAGLKELAEASGGRHRRLDDVGQIQDAFSDIADYLKSTHQVCADLPWSQCGDVTLQTDWTWTAPDGATYTGRKFSTVHVPCEAQRGPGRQATIVLTMSNPGVPQEVASRLASNAIDWVAPKSQPKVLVVLDNGHHDEFLDDASFVRDRLAELAYDVTLVDERSGGLLPEDVAGYDVVWFTNPGYPWDDVRTIDTLKAFIAAGGGLVTQGDDITYSMGNSFNVSELVHLDFKDNGTATCGQLTDNNAGQSFTVTFGSGHPLVEGLEGVSFEYGNDIDDNVPSGAGEVVLGSATFASGECSTTRPVLSAFDPNL
ncbi:MAG: VWA domain-containing protein [Kofleriaceae bacterium]